MFLEPTGGRSPQMAGSVEDDRRRLKPTAKPVCSRAVCLRRSKLAVLLGEPLPAALLFGWINCRWGMPRELVRSKLC